MNLLGLIFISGMDQRLCMSDDSKYLRLGVDSRKKDVELFKHLIPNILPGAFTPVCRDDERMDRGLILHLDGAGSKPIISYLCYRELGGSGWFEGLSQDVLAMNINDVIAVAAQPILFADYIAINPFRIPKDEVIAELAKGFKKTLELLSNYQKDFKITPTFAGGETADLPDQVRTLDVVGALFGILDIEKSPKLNRIRAGDLIIGLRSDGRAVYENRENSGIMCNGISLARHVLLKREYYQCYPEIGEPEIAEKYSGRFTLDSFMDELDMSLAEALLSPTRIYAPIIAEILMKNPEEIKAMCHNTGGGLAKIKRIGRGVRYVKDNLPEPSPIFGLIQREGKISWREMYETFNMGIGFEIIVEKDYEDEIIQIAEKYKIIALVIGKIDSVGNPANEVIIKSRHGIFIY
jgi:phosphoribosylformylglycinamidine cyclo-ligase